MAFNRYDPLPGITSPRPDKSDNFTEPMMQPVPMLMAAKMPLDVQRMQAIELRVAALEHANKMLLDELVSTKNESKGAIRRVESAVSDEIVNQRNISENFKSSSDFLSQLSLRVKRNEEQIQSGQNSLNGVVDQMRRLNQMITSGQTNASGRTDLLDNRVMELHSNVEEGRTERQQVMTLTAALGDKMKSLEQKVDSKLQDLNSFSLDMKKRSLLNEDETRSIVDQFKKAQEYQKELDYSNHQMKTQFDSRIAEFQAVVNDLRNRNMKEETDKRSFDQLLSRKVNDLQFTVTDLQRSCSDVQQESSRLKQEMTSLFETESSKLNEQVSRLADEFRRKLHDSETKMKEESTRRIVQMEKSLADEKESRLHSEKALKNELKDDLTDFKDKLKDELNALKKYRKTDKQKVNESLNVIYESVNSVEKHQDHWFEKLTKSLRAEIKTRENTAESVEKQISDMDKKFAKALSMIEDKIKTPMESVSQEPVPIAKTPPDIAARQKSLNDLESKVKDLTEKLSQIQTSLEKKTSEDALLRNSISSLSMNKASEAQSVNEALREIIDWYKKSTNQVAGVNKLFQEKVAPRLDDVEKEMEKVKEVTFAKIIAEKSERLSEIQKLHHVTFEHVKKVEEDQKTELKNFTLKMKNDTKHLQNAVMKIDQKIREFIDEELYKINQQSSEEKKKKTDQIMEIRQELDKLILVNDQKSQVNRTFFGTNQPIFDFQNFPPSWEKRSRSRDQPRASRDSSKLKTSETQTVSEMFTQTDPERKTPKALTDKSGLRKSSKTRQNPLETGTGSQTQESFLAGITLTCGKPTLGTQTGPSFYREPESPGFGVQTSFRSSPEGGVYTQTSQIFGNNKSRTFLSDPNRRASLQSASPRNVQTPTENLDASNKSGSNLGQNRVEGASQSPEIKPEEIVQKEDSQENPGETENQEPAKDSVPRTSPENMPENNGETNPEVISGSKQASRESSNATINRGPNEPNADELHYTPQSRRSKTRSLPMDEQEPEF